MSGQMLLKLFNKVMTFRYKIKTGFFCKNKEKSFVLMFHHVCDNPRDDKFGLSTERFVSIIESIANRNSFIEPSSLFTSNGVLLTFDDGYADIYTVVYPLLKKMRIPFLVFLTTNFVGTEGYLTWDQIKELNKEQLCHFGAHSMSHPKLRFSKESNVEIDESISKIEKQLHEKVDYFSYPYGTYFACSRRNIKEARNSGVKYAFSAIPGYLNSFAKKNYYFLPRFNAASRDINKIMEGKK